LGGKPTGSFLAGDARKLPFGMAAVRMAANSGRSLRGHHVLTGIARIAASSLPYIGLAGIGQHTNLPISGHQRKTVNHASIDQVPLSDP